MNSRARLLAVLALTCGVMALLATGCGGRSGSPPPDYARALRDAPPPLAKLYSQANQLLPGGKDAFEKRLETLRGYPVVVNAWASWCGGCLFEFPHFQKLSARFGTRVAFIGIDSQDSDDAATTWLREAPVPYPSYIDHDRDLAQDYKAGGLPHTAFYNRQGELVWLKQGNYRDSDELEAEIKKYALGSS